MELNVEKINQELKRLGKKRNWLAKEIGCDHQLLYYWLNTKSLRGAEPIADLFKMNPKDLIK